MKNENDLKLKAIRRDHGIELNFDGFDEFCNEHAISHKFSAAHTLQKNGVAERKNRTLEETKRKFLVEAHLPNHVYRIDKSLYGLKQALRHSTNHNIWTF